MTEKQMALRQMRRRLSSYASAGSIVAAIGVLIVSSILSFGQDRVVGATIIAIFAGCTLGYFTAYLRWRDEMARLRVDDSPWDIEDW